MMLYVRDDMLMCDCWFVTLPFSFSFLTLMFLISNKWFEPKKSILGKRLTLNITFNDNFTV